ncbi:hypothetical protein [Actinoplanes sp. TFC3]|uniref:hypothetical protein n=1 Tax=Actinoplanes sp. TFC3 TaxID=1710355 RepID=UPI00082E28FB|nr:hypothetical protein [Actinoplanes sp. TFC3]
MNGERLTGVRVGGELRERTGERQQELADRHDLLLREDAGSARHDDLLRRVFDATNDLIVVLDEGAGQATRRRGWAAGLVLFALVAGVLAGLRVLPVWTLAGAAVVFVAATVVLPFPTRKTEAGHEQ